MLTGIIGKIAGEQHPISCSERNANVKVIVFFITV